jgi:hypothetical protein
LIITQYPARRRYISRQRARTFAFRFLTGPFFRTGLVGLLFCCSSSPSDSSFFFLPRWRKSECSLVQPRSNHRPSSAVRFLPEITSTAVPKRAREENENVVMRQWNTSASSRFCITILKSRTALRLKFLVRFTFRFFPNLIKYASKRS